MGPCGSPGLRTDMRSDAFREPSRRCGAFTLVEAAVVLFCAMTLLAAGIPAFQHLQEEFSLWSSARLLECSLQWGRQRAVAANGAVAFSVLENGGSYRWVDAASGEAIHSSARHLAGDARIAEAPRTPVRFFPSGRAAPAGTYVVRGRAGAYRVIVAPSGRIRVQRD